jgi:hypothetical protein
MSLDCVRLQGDNVVWGGVLLSQAVTWCVWTGCPRFDTWIVNVHISFQSADETEVVSCASTPPLHLHTNLRNKDIFHTRRDDWLHTSSWRRAPWRKHCIMSHNTGLWITMRWDATGRDMTAHTAGGSSFCWQANLIWRHSEEVCTGMCRITTVRSTTDSIYVGGPIRLYYDILQCIRGTRWCSGWGNALQTGRSRFRFPMVSLDFFIDIILLVAL